jgi:hypothetical protein
MPLYRRLEKNVQLRECQEMIHSTRIIPVDGRPHIGQDIRLWHGDSRGHWEGESLVIETADFNNKGLVGDGRR